MADVYQKLGYSKEATAILKRIIVNKPDVIQKFHRIIVYRKRIVFDALNSGDVELFIAKIKEFGLGDYLKDQPKKDKPAAKDPETEDEPDNN